MSDTQRTFEEWDNTRPFPHPDHAQEIVFEGSRCVVIAPEEYAECFRQAASRAALLAESPDVAGLVEWLKQDINVDEERFFYRSVDQKRAIIAALLSQQAQIQAKEAELADAQKERDALILHLNDALAARVVLCNNSNIEDARDPTEWDEMCQRWKAALDAAKEPK